MNTQQFDVTVAERQLIECLRSIHTRRHAMKFRLVIELEGGAWEIEMSEEESVQLGRIAVGRKIVARGVGATFDLAWSGIEPTWV
jgi:hypothetical protein